MLESPLVSQPLNLALTNSELALEHEQEWLDSGVDRGIIRLNVRTLGDTAIDPYTHEASYPIAEHLHWSVTRFGQEARANVRGWWVSGIDPFSDWQRMEWGRFKPDAETPVFDRAKRRPAKYLSPSLGKGSSRLVLLEVPESVWQQVADRYQIAMPTQLEAKQSFWRWAWENNLPLVLTEGEKKAGCLLSLGYVAIALPGIFSGYRRDTRQLIAELAHFATEGRSVHICFDYETKPKTVQNIVLATSRLGQLLTRAGCEVKIIALPGPQKGVDDFVVACGQEAFAEVHDSAITLEFWQASRLWSLTYAPTIALNQPYLGDLPYPTSGLVGVKSPKGTGKTTALQNLIKTARTEGRRVLVITHRIQLGKAICNSLDLDWIEDLQESENQGNVWLWLVC